VSKVGLDRHDIERIFEDRRAFIERGVRQGRIDRQDESLQQLDLPKKVTEKGTMKYRVAQK
jgi:hypothetical protein